MDGFSDRVRPVRTAPRWVPFVVVGILAACSVREAGEQTGLGTNVAGTAVATTVAAPPNGLKWWNDRVFYEVFVRSFKDSDGDGIGDLRGLTASLDELNDADPATTDDLGITGIWLMPIFPSPSYHGYDVTDYRSINPDYGSMADFEAFLAAAHDRGIVVLIDLVLNHTSILHPWFAASAGGDPAYADWYRWSATNPGTAAPWGNAPVWHWRQGRFYFGLFSSDMPDLNLQSAEVTSELHDIARFWLNIGVDGFRLDGARHLIEAGDVMADTPATLAWLEDFTTDVHRVAPGALVLGEVWSPTEVVATYVPGALDLAFEFDLAASVMKAGRLQDKGAVEQAMSTVLDAYPALQYATFLTNHDMSRLMSQVGGDVRIAELAATWLLTAPGVPFLYYGEEVGLSGAKPDEQIRTPMPWTGDGPGVGFTTGTPWEAPDAGFPAFNVAVETSDPHSLLSRYRTLIQVRAASPALRRGDVIPVQTNSATVSAYLRSAGTDRLLVVLNLAPSPAVGVSLDLEAGPLAGTGGVETLVGSVARAPGITTAGGFSSYEPLDSLPPYGSLVLRLNPGPQT